MTDIKDLEKINSFSRRELSAEEVYVFNVELCNNDIDRDFEKFSLNALKEMAPMFIGKTGIADHSMKSSDQKARIFDCAVERKNGKTADGEPLYCLKAKAYMLRNENNKALIEEIEAGIKKEVSVSCSVEKSICSVCGKDRKKEPCRHINGRRYDGKLCFTVLDGAKDAYEFSFVAVPAQKDAGVTKAFKIKEDDMQGIIKTIKENRGALELSEKQAKELLNYISALEEEAQLGEEYKKELSSEVIRLFAKKFPEMDKKLFSSVVSVMTVKELLGFREGFEKAAEPPVPQLAPAETKNKKDYSQFRI